MNPASESLRLATTLDETASRFGPIADLIGTWVGTGNGWNVIAVPSKDEQQVFVLEAVKYNETITFAAGATQVPNKGGSAGEQFNQAVTYSLAVSAVDGAVPLHVEDGMWLFMSDAAKPIARQAIVPHGNSALLVGTSAAHDGPPTITEMSTVPLDNSKQPITNEGYLKQYRDIAASTFSDVLNPNKTLQDAIADEKISKTTLFDLASDPGGGLVNTPFITSHANATEFTMSLWLETVETPNGSFQQLQYSQVTMLFFADIFWPHVNVNTLRKFA